MHADTIQRVLAYWRGRESESGPTGIVSVVTIDREQFVLAPERLRSRVADASTLRLVTMNELPVIAADNARLVAMEAISDPSEWREASADEACDLRVGVLEAGALVALATLQAWGGAIGHVSVFTAAHARGRGLAAGAGSAVVERALTLGLVPQWRSRLGNDASARVADKLGFIALGRQIFVRTDGM